MHKFKSNFKSAKAFIVVRSVLALLFVWCLLLLILLEIDSYSRVKELKAIHWMISGETTGILDRSSIEKRHVCNIASSLVRLIDYPNIESVESIQADNKKALSYMTEDMAKMSSWYLEWRVQGIRLFLQMNKNAKAYHLQDLQTELVTRENLLENVNKSLANQDGYYVLVEGKMVAFDDRDGKEIHSTSIRRLVHLVAVPPTVEKPNPWLVDSIVSLDWK